MEGEVSTDYKLDLFSPRNKVYLLTVSKVMRWYLVVACNRIQADSQVPHLYYRSSLLNTDCFANPQPLPHARKN